MKYWQRVQDAILEDERRLFNDVARKALNRYIFIFIKKSRWMYSKTFVDAIDILLQVQEEIINIPISEYGSAATTPLSWVLKKIRKAVNQKWFEYVKDTNPEYYMRYMCPKKEGGERAWNKYNKSTYERAKITDRYKRTAKKCQKGVRDRLTDSYVLQQVSAKLKRDAGMSFSFEEIRADYKYLINETRQRILEKRRVDFKYPELTDSYVSFKIRDDFKKQGVEMSPKEVRDKYPEMIVDRRKAIEEYRTRRQNTAAVKQQAA